MFLDFPIERAFRYSQVLSRVFALAIVFLQRLANHLHLLVLKRQRLLNKLLSVLNVRCRMAVVVVRDYYLRLIGIAKVGLASNTSGSQNVFMGQYAGAYNTKGKDNVFLGTNAGQVHKTGDNNVALGNGAAHSADGMENSEIIGTRIVTLCGS